MHYVPKHFSSYHVSILFKLAGDLFNNKQTCGLRNCILTYCYVNTRVRLKNTWLDNKCKYLIFWSTECQWTYVRMGNFAIFRQKMRVLQNKSLIDKLADRLQCFQSRKKLKFYKSLIMFRTSVVEIYVWASNLENKAYQITRHLLIQTSKQDLGWYI